MLFSLFLFSCADGRSSSGQPAWPQLGPTDTAPATLDEGPFDALVTYRGFGSEYDPGWGHLTVHIFASPAPRELAEAFLGEDEDCSVESAYPPRAEQGPDHVLVNVGGEVLSVPPMTDVADYLLLLPDGIPAGTTFGLSGTQTLAVLAVPDLTPRTIDALDSWDGGSPVDIAWTPGSDETLMVDVNYTSCRVVNDGLWTVPAIDNSDWDLGIRRGVAVAVDSREFGHVLMYAWSSVEFEIWRDVPDDM